MRDYSGVTIVYDGECPFCSAYVRMVRLREAAGPVHLVDARGGGPVVEEIQDAGLDLDKGMAVRIDGALYHGADAMHVLSLLSTPYGVFNRAMRQLFGRPRLSRMLYPPLAAGRNLTLTLLGRTRIRDKR